MRPLITLALSAAAIGGRLLSLAGLRRAPRLDRPQAKAPYPVTASTTYSSARFAPAIYFRPARGWWSEPQSEASIKWHKERAARRRLARGESWNASNYARNNCPAS